MAHIPITEVKDEPVEAAPPEEPIKRRRRSHPLAVALLLTLIVALAGAAAILGYAYYFQKPVSLPTAPLVDDSKKTLTANQTLAAIKTVFPSQPLDNPDLSVPIKVAGYKYYTQLDQTHAKGLHASTPYTDSAVTTAKIAKVLKEKQFTETIVQSGNAESEYIAQYTHTDVVCSVTATKTANNPTGNHEVAVACANMADYSSLATVQRPFYQAYPNKPTDDSTNLVFVGTPVISPSKTSGYQTATVSIGGVQADGTPGIGGFAGLFYQTPDKTWHFFKSAQNELACSEYNGDDVKKAYLGMSCTDTTGKPSTVGA